MEGSPVNLIVCVDNFYMQDFIFQWMYCNQPCKLLFEKPKTPGLTAVKLMVDNDEAANFILCVKAKNDCKIYDSRGIIVENINSFLGFPQQHNYRAVSRAGGTPRNAVPA